MISAVVAALLFVNAGVLYVMSSANPGNIAKAHKIFTSTLVGAVIIFASWLLINTVMSSLVNRGNIRFTGWNNLLCTDNMAASDTVIAPPVVTPPVVVTPPITPPVNPGTASESGARTILGNAGITVNGGPQQTRLEGLQPTTVAGAIGLRNALGIPLVITGGTEKGEHVLGEMSHANGYKLDFGTNSNPQLTPAAMQSVLNSGTVTRVHDGVTETGYTGYINGKRVVAYREDVGTGNEHWDVIFHENI